MRASSFSGVCHFAQRGHLHTVGGFGYRRLHDLIRPEFVPVNHKRIERMYREAHLAVHRRRKAKRPRSERQPLQAATMPQCGVEHGLRQRCIGQRTAAEVPDGAMRFAYCNGPGAQWRVDERQMSPVTSMPLAIAVASSIQ